MATPNRSALINRTLKVLQEALQAGRRRRRTARCSSTCCSPACLEDSPHEAAEQVFATLKQDYFGWNEVRVSTIRELTDALKPLVNPAESAARLKQTLHSVFESVYEFDIETLKKQNIGQAAKHAAEVQRHDAVRRGLRDAARAGRALDSAQPRRADHAAHRRRDLRRRVQPRASCPGLERAVPKNKGAEVGSLLHQLGVEVGRNPYGPAARKLMLEIDPNCKDRLPKRPTPKPPEPPPPRRRPPTPEPKARPPRATARRTRPPKQAAGQSSRRRKPSQEAAAEAAAADQESRRSRPSSRRRRSPRNRRRASSTKTKTKIRQSESVSR